jgi:hypothetical protein
MSRIRPSVFKCQSLKYFVSLWSSSRYCFDSFTLIRNNGHDKRSSRRHEGALEPHPGLSVSLAARGSRPDHGSARASRHQPLLPQALPREKDSLNKINQKFSRPVENDWRPGRESNPLAAKAAAEREPTSESEATSPARRSSSLSSISSPARGGPARATRGCAKLMAAFVRHARGSPTIISRLLLRTRCAARQSAPRRWRDWRMTRPPAIRSS